MQNKKITEILAWILIALFAYTGGYKVFAHTDFIVDLHKQIFPRGWIPFLSVSIPLSEILCILLLLFLQTRLVGFMVSNLLMAAFTLYVTGAVLNLYPRVPCACGGALKNIGWLNHLIFNFAFLILSFLGIILTLKERRLRKNR